MSEVKLSDVRHDYYCSDGCFFGSPGYRTHETFESWADFLVEMDDADFDLNLLFRWDWEPASDDPEDEQPTPTLALFYVRQRKAYNCSYRVKVRDEDEPAIREWLRPRWEHLRKLWASVSGGGGRNRRGGVMKYVVAVHFAGEPRGCVVYAETREEAAVKAVQSLASVTAPDGCGMVGVEVRTSLLGLPEVFEVPWPATCKMPLTVSMETDATPEELRVAEDVYEAVFGDLHRSSLVRMAKEVSCE